MRGETSEMGELSLVKRRPGRVILLSCLSILSDLVGGYDKLMDLSFPLAKELKFLPSLPDPENSLSLEECQVKAQEILSSKVRKLYAVYYTTDDGAEIISSRASLHEGSNLVVADPFVGSGRLLAKTVEKIGIDRISLVWGIEPLSLQALVAYTSLMKVLRDPSKVRIVDDDAFSLITSFSGLPDFPRADIIVTNPPFTRWKLLFAQYRRKLLALMERLGYSSYITRRELGLQIASMFLVDYALKENGFLGTVLPASTFYTIYGRGYKELLLSKYYVEALIESSNTSFSRGSGFKELILLAIKAKMNHRTLIAKFDGHLRKLDEINLEKLPKFLQTNWLSLFNPLRSLVTQIFEEGLSKGSLGYWRQVLSPNIVRGLEMYGPEFFFIPNRYWSIVDEGKEGLVIAKGGMELFIGREFLVRALRKPSIYARKIKVKPESYMLSIPPIPLEELPGDLRRYIKWGERSGSAASAIRAFGKKWYSHVHAQISSKHPFGRVFIPDKIDIMFKRRGVFANYSREPVAASKNFYIIKDDEDSAKVIAAWLNSTIFLAVLHLMGRRISNTWTRLLEDDYLELPMIHPRGDMKEVKRALDSIKERELPPMWEQLGSSYRRSLDVSFLEWIGLDTDYLEEIYSTLEDLINNKGEEREITYVNGQWLIKCPFI